MSWTTRAEAEIRMLRDVDDASILAEGEDVLEIHVVTASRRPAKQIVRDIQSLLATRFSRQIDHRIVSVAYIDRLDSPPAPAVARDSGARDSAPRSNGGAAKAAAKREDFQVAVQDRIRFLSANVFVSGARVQAQVELRWRGAAKMGDAAGWSTRDGVPRLVAQATVAAVQEYLPTDLALSLEAVEFVRIGRHPAVVVALELLEHREHKALFGCSAAGEDRNQAIVFATLDAVNRLLGHLPARETPAVP